MPYKWTPPPPTDRTLEIPGHSKVYRPGDMVPISKDAAEHMMRTTDHAFEGLDLPEPPPPSGGPAAPATAASGKSE